jgi:hypothetical protein
MRTLPIRRRRFTPQSALRPELGVPAWRLLWLGLIPILVRFEFAPSVFRRLAWVGGEGTRRLVKALAILYSRI